MKVKPRRVEDVAELRRLVDAEKFVVQRDRMRAVLLALEGEEALAIAAKLGRGRTFVQDWVYAYRDGGLDALRSKPRPGRPPRLTPDRLRELAQRGSGDVCRSDAAEGSRDGAAVARQGRTGSRARRGTR